MFRSKSMNNPGQAAARGNLPVQKPGFSKKPGFFR
jgi:hypothetical protein